MSSEEVNTLRKKLDSVDITMQPKSPSNPSPEIVVEEIPRAVDSTVTKRKRGSEVEVEDPMTAKRAKKSGRASKTVSFCFACFSMLTTTY